MSNASFDTGAGVGLLSCISTCGARGQADARRDPMTDLLKSSISLSSQLDNIAGEDQGEGHLFVCVHGLEGNQYDIRQYKLELIKLLPKATFLMAEANAGDTHASCVLMAERLLDELKAATARHKPSHVSFVCHSLGNVVLRTMLTLAGVHEVLDMSGDVSVHNSSLDGFVHDSILPEPFLYLSLSGPHLGVTYLGSMVTTGMWLMSRWNRSSSIPQLELKDARDIRHTLLFKLSEHTGLTAFKNVVLVGSPKDGYSPMNTALLLPEPKATPISRTGQAYEQMRENLLLPLATNPRINFLRVQVVFKTEKRSLTAAIGRTAHVSLLDDVGFVRKLVVSLLPLFKRY